MSRHYFGTDGIRGTIGQEPMTPDVILKIGQAAGTVIARHTLNKSGNKKAKVLIGKDTRVSGYLLESCLEAGFTSVGVDVLLVGPMPTAGVAYLARALNMSAGVVISASHNPHQDNGIKFFSGEGTKLPDAWEIEIEQQLAIANPCKASEDLGKARRLDDAAGRYIEFCKSTFPWGEDLSGLKLVVDCANGAAYQIAPAVFRELGAEVISLADQPNGLNINHGVGATHPEYVAAAVLQHKADYGFALDGDADRLICVDSTGRIFNGDELLFALVMERLVKKGHVKGVVGTLMTNLGLELALKGLEVPFERAKVGDRYVFEKLIANDWCLGGESSGHLLVLDRHSTGDGIVSALQVLRAIRALNKSLAEILEPVQMLPQVLKNARLPVGYDWSTDAKVQAQCDAVRGELGERGRLLIRPSGTEPVLRVMVETADRGFADRMVESILHVLPKP